MTGILCWDTKLVSCDDCLLIELVCNNASRELNESHLLIHGKRTIKGAASSSREPPSSSPSIPATGSSRGPTGESAMQPDKNEEFSGWHSLSSSSCTYPQDDHNGARRRSSASSRDTVTSSFDMLPLQRRLPDACEAWHDPPHPLTLGSGQYLGRLYHSTPSSPSQLPSTPEGHPQYMPHSCVKRADSLPASSLCGSPRLSPEHMEMAARLHLAECSTKIMMIVEQYNKEHDELTQRFCKDLPPPLPRKRGALRQKRQLSSTHSLWVWSTQDSRVAGFTNSLQAVAFASILLLYFVILITTIPMANANGSVACSENGGTCQRRPVPSDSLTRFLTDQRLRPAWLREPSSSLLSQDGEAGPHKEGREAAREQRRFRLFSVFAKRS